MSEEFQLKAKDFHIASTSIRCWQCDEETRVFSILVEELMEEDGNPVEEEAVALSYIERVNPDVQNLLYSLSQGMYHQDFSQTVGEEYFINHCHNCEAKIGDFYLPQYFTPWAKITLAHYRVELKADCSFNVGSASLILSSQNQYPPY